VIFAVLDVSLAVNVCINCSFLHLFTSMSHWPQTGNKTEWFSDNNN